MIFSQKFLLAHWLPLAQPLTFTSRVGRAGIDWELGITGALHLQQSFHLSMTMDATRIFDFHPLWPKLNIKDEYLRVSTPIYSDLTHRTLTQADHATPPATPMQQQWRVSYLQELTDTRHDRQQRHNNHSSGNQYSPLFPLNKLSVPQDVVSLMKTIGIARSVPVIWICTTRKHWEEKYLEKMY